MDKLDTLRKQLDNIDQEIVKLLQQRAAISIQVGKAKREQESNPVYFRPEREKQILKNIAQIKGDLPPDALGKIYQQIFEVSRELQYHHCPKNFSGKVVIIGLGLIGGSLALNLLDHPQVSIHGIDKNTEHTKLALQLKLAHSVSNTIDKKIQDANIIVIATPVDTIVPILKKIKPYLNDKTIITDVGSTKLISINAAKTILGEQAYQFIPGHPLAGTEFSGPTAAKKNLFHAKKIVLTPFTNHESKAFEQIRQLWQLCGTEIIEMDANKHDQALAQTSHLLHMLVFALMALCAENPETVAKLQAVSFEGVTRIAKNSPDMWMPIALSNPYLIEIIKKYKIHLTEIEQAIEQKDGPCLLEIFDQARLVKATIEENG